MDHQIAPEKEKDSSKGISEIAHLAESLNPFDFLPHASIGCDVDGHILFFNARARTLFGEGCSRGKRVGHILDQRLGLLDGTKLNYEQSAIGDALARGACLQNKESLIQNIDGSWNRYRVTVHPLKNELGIFFGALCTFANSAELVESDTLEASTYSKILEQANSELIEAREASLRTAAAQSEFLSNMSHEIRTPMNAVMGMAEVLWETELSEEQRKIVTVLMRGGRNLLAIINDVLEYSRLESGQLPASREEFDLRESLSKIIDLMKPLADAKGLSLNCEFQDELRTVCGDSKKLGQVLINLIGNAIKFTHNGEVKIRVSHHSSMATSAPQGQVLFQVIDTGVGIPAEKLGALFKRFSQADMSVTKNYGGTGLGLAISKQLVELMGGCIWVESQSGTGSTFSFTCKLPSVEKTVQKSEAHQEFAIGKLSLEQRQSEESFQGLHILLVEDSEDNAMLIQHYLKNIGCTLDFAQNGQEAIEKFEKYKYDLILMDIQMPVMDGYSATRWIRILEMRYQRRVPIIALTAYSMSEEVKKSLDAGCDAHLSKPLSKKSLLDAIAAQVEGVQTESASQSLPM